jgi:hypothetical protein
VERLRIAIVCCKFLPQLSDILLNGIDEASLVFLDGTANFGSDEESIELGEDPEHFLGIAGSRELIPQAGDDLIFDPSDSVVVGSLCRVPDLRALLFMSTLQPENI